MSAGICPGKASQPASRAGGQPGGLAVNARDCVRLNRKKKTREKKKKRERERERKREKAAGVGDVHAGGDDMASINVGGVVC